MPLVRRNTPAFWSPSEDTWIPDLKRRGGVRRLTGEYVSLTGTFSGNPLTLTTGAATLKYLQENSEIYADMMAKADKNLEVTP